MRSIGIIPSRWQSSRFPGKSLALIAGKPMIQESNRTIRKSSNS